jgi:hypothetical protein
MRSLSRRLRGRKFNTGKDKDQIDRKSKSDKVPLEDLARKIDPPSRETQR